MHHLQEEIQSRSGAVKDRKILLLYMQGQMAVEILDWRKPSSISSRA
jgi:hypothetical protein